MTSFAGDIAVKLGTASITVPTLLEINMQTERKLLCWAYRHAQEGGVPAGLQWHGASLGQPFG